MKIKNTCGAARGFGRIVIKPEQVFDIDDPVAATWFLRHGCVDATIIESSDIEVPALDDGLDDGGSPNNGNFTGAIPDVTPPKPRRRRKPRG